MVSVIDQAIGSGVIRGNMRASINVGDVKYDGKVVNLTESAPASWVYSTSSYNQPVSLQSDYGYAWMNGPWGVEVKDSDQSPIGGFAPLVVRVEIPESLRANGGFEKIKIHGVEHDIVQYQD